jgi:predicted O-linked N-acetylglucosamine transferase (SPINDLY family)
VLTLPASPFASRVASSLLHAIGLPELIADSADAYRNLAVRLANHPAELNALKARLKQQVQQSSVYNPADFCQRFETAIAEQVLGRTPA